MIFLLLSRWPFVAYEQNEWQQNALDSRIRHFFFFFRQIRSHFNIVKLEFLRAINYPILRRRYTVARPSIRISHTAAKEHKILLPRSIDCWLITVYWYHVYATPQLVGCLFVWATSRFFRVVVDAFLNNSWTIIVFFTIVCSLFNFEYHNQTDRCRRCFSNGVNCYLFPPQIRPLKYLFFDRHFSKVYHRSKSSAVSHQCIPEKQYNHFATTFDITLPAKLRASKYCNNQWKSFILLFLS